MDGWLVGCIADWLDGWVDGWMNGWLFKQMAEKMNYFGLGGNIQQGNNIYRRHVSCSSIFYDRWRQGMGGDGAAAFGLSQINDQLAMQIDEMTMQCAMGCHSEVLHTFLGKSPECRAEHFWMYNVSPRNVIRNTQPPSMRCQEQQCLAVTCYEMEEKNAPWHGRRLAWLVEGIKMLYQNIRHSNWLNLVSTQLDRVLGMDSPHFNAINAAKSFNSQKIFRITIQIGININSQ